MSSRGTSWPKSATSNSDRSPPEPLASARTTRRPPTKLVVVGTQPRGACTEKWPSDATAGPPKFSEISTPMAMTATIARMPTGSNSFHLTGGVPWGKGAESVPGVLGATGSCEGPPAVKAGAPASATVSRTWQRGQTVSPLMYHVQQLRQTARLTRDPHEGN